MKFLSVILSNCPIFTSVMVKLEKEICKEFSEEKITKPSFGANAIIKGLKPVLFRNTKIESFTFRMRFPRRCLSKNSAARLLSFFSSINLINIEYIWNKGSPSFADPIYG